MCRSKRNDTNYPIMRKIIYEAPEAEVILVSQEHNFATYNDDGYNQDNNQVPKDEGDVDF